MALLLCTFLQWTGTSAGQADKKLPNYPLQISHLCTTGCRNKASGRDSDWMELPQLDCYGTWGERTVSFCIHTWIRTLHTPNITHNRRSHYNKIGIICQGKKKNNYRYISRVKNKTLLKITLTVDGTPFSFLQNGLAR